jgi:dTDP-4-dehydrorhamnose reductase
MNNLVLVTGANGQLAQEIRELEPAWPQYRFVFVSKEELPVTNSNAVHDFFKQSPPAYCINCAAYTKVDKAEEETDLAVEVNGTAVGHLAAICAEYQTQLIHISTDYVFDGTNNEPYKEDHPVQPVNAYGASKLKGEELAIANNPAAIIIRTSWVYSRFGHNFVKTMLRLMQERDSVKVVNDQFGSPTYAADLATAIMQIIASETATPATEKTGSLASLPVMNNIYHYANQGMISWYDFAVAIRDLAGLACEVYPIPTTDYPTPAKRPHYSVLATEKIREKFVIDIPHWKDGLERMLATTL